MEALLSLVVLIEQPQFFCGDAKKWPDAFARGLTFFLKYGILVQSC